MKDHAVVKREEKVYKILINGKQQDVSINRLKPTYVIDDPERESQQPKKEETRGHKTRYKRTSKLVTFEL